jgi:FKBP12-rapamycin complex-associated protein
MEALSALAFQLGPDFAPFVPLVSKATAADQIISPQYDQLINAILKSQPMVYEFPKPAEEIRRKLAAANSSGSDSGAEVDDGKATGAASKLKVNVQNLQNAWEAAQRTTKDDWIEWIRKLSIELLQESPSKALKSCAALAQGNCFHCMYDDVI